MGPSSVDEWKKSLIRSHSITAEQQAISLVEREGSYTESEVEQVFNALKPLPSPQFMFGSWNGGVIETGHPGGKALKETEWAGRDIRGIDDVDPIICVDDENKRHWNEAWGHASVGVLHIEFLSRGARRIYHPDSAERARYSSCVRWSFEARLPLP